MRLDGVWRGFVLGEVRTIKIHLLINYDGLCVICKLFLCEWCLYLYFFIFYHLYLDTSIN